MIQISPQMRILVAVEAIDFRNGIDGLARICKEALQTDREQGMSPDERLHLHQAESGQRMKELEKWFKEQFTERKVEPNSGLGEAILYMQTHWNKLTLFLRQAGAPLDNNLVERALKMAILHRKNALFYKTQNGARVGDLFMSLIYTCCQPFQLLDRVAETSPRTIPKPSRVDALNYRNMLEHGGVASCEAPG